MSGSQVVGLQMVENARSVNAKLLTKKLGATETNIVPNMSARFAFPKCGFKQSEPSEVTKCKKCNRW